MFTLLRIAFWLTIVLVLLPSGGSQKPDQPSIGATEAVTAAGVAVSDMSGFCERQREACAVGSQAATVIGQRAQAGAKMVYEFLTERSAQSDGNTGPERKSAVRDLPASAGLRGTLSTADVEPAWQGSPGRGENVPLPRKDPRRKA